MAPGSADVFLLGAGFARAISPAMPLLQDLARRILKRSHGSRLPPEVASMMRENFAHALSYLELAKPWLTEAENLRHRAHFLEISNAIARDLDDIVHASSSSLSENPPTWLCRLLTHWHEQRCTVLTLNYDVIIETIVASLELAEGRPISAHALYPPLLTDARLRAGGSTDEMPGGSFRLLKLHGSTNWFYSGRGAATGEPIYFVPPPGNRRGSPQEEAVQALRMKAVADKYPFLVPPIYDKSALFTHETIRALWFQAGKALREAKRIVCMGYSLPESDLTMSHFLRTCCGPTATFAIVNQTGDALPRFKRLFTGTRVQVRQLGGGPRCIPTFVKRHLEH